MRLSLTIFIICFMFVVFATIPGMASASGPSAKPEQELSTSFTGNRYEAPTEAQTGTPIPAPDNRSLPDLTIVQMRIELRHPGCLRPEDSLGVRVWIKNQGQASAGNFYVVVNHATQLVTELAAGETKALFFPGYANPVFAIVDSTFAIAESKEANNARFEHVPVPTPPLPCPTNTPTPTVQLLPDLVISQMRIELKNTRCFTPGDPLGVRLIIENRGQAGAGDFMVKVNGKAKLVKGLAAGQMKAVFFRGYSNPVTAMVDSTSIIAESDESNNTRSEWVPVPTPPLPCPTNTPTPTPTSPPLPDLTISAMRIELRHPSCLQPGDPLGVRMFLSNHGQAAAGNFMLAVNGKEKLVKGLAAGQTKAVFFWGYSNPVMAMVDSTHLILESNENNNTRSELVPVPTPPLPCATVTPTATP